MTHSIWRGCMALAAAAYFLVPSQGWGFWQQPAGGASLNRHATETAQAPGLTGVGDTPYVVWPETDQAFQYVQVKRLSADGSNWVQVGGDQVSDSYDINSVQTATFQGTPCVTRSENVSPDGDDVF